MSITQKELVDAFAPSTGIEKARAIIDDAVKELHMAARHEYTLEESLEICNLLKKHGSIIKIVALCFRSTVTLKLREKTMSLFDKPG